MKVLKVVLSVLLSTLLFSQTAYAYNPTTDVEYISIGPLCFEKNLPDLENISGIMGNYVLAVTPASVMDLFYQEGVKIYITQSVPFYERAEGTAMYNARCYAATFSYNSSNKITKVSAPVSLYIYHDSQRADAYVHECGHALDFIAEYITGYYQGQSPISNSEEWQRLYLTYGPIMAAFDGGAAANMYNSAEAFAEAYRLYFTYPQQLQTFCPEVYNFVTAQIAKYTAYVPALCYDNFDYESYYNLYPDVAAAYGLDKKALWDHYINCGQNEGRSAYRIIKVKR